MAHSIVVFDDEANISKLTRIVIILVKKSYSTEKPVVKLGGG